MKASSLYCPVIILITGIVFIPCFAQEDTPNSAKTVELVYPNLATGVLTYAKIGILPEGILLKCNGIEISRKDIDQNIARQPKQLRRDLTKNAFFLLEQEANDKLLLKIAGEELSKEDGNISSMPDSRLAATFFERLTRDISVNDQDIEKFYKENESVFCGTPLDKVRKQIESYVLTDKKQRFRDQFIKDLGRKMEIIVSESWIKTQAEAAGNNPLDKARANGKPTLAVFSAKSCCGADRMLPVLSAVRKRYNEKINIVYIEPRREQILAGRYGIRSIPSEIFYKNNGKEFYRHSGFLSEKNISDKLSEMGIK